MKKLRLVSLFAGIGAVEMGAYRVYNEVELTAAAEIDKFARQSYKAIHKIDNDHFYTDIREMDGNKYNGIVDCVSFGFPCQDYSIAGKRAGIEGQRGTLFYEGARIVNEIRPPIFIAENVKGLLSSNGGKDYKIILDILRNDLGYYCHYEVINTKDYGVPQNRERLFLVGFLDHEHYHRFQFAPKVKLEKRLRDILEDDVDEKYYLSQKMIDYVTTQSHLHQSANQIQEGDISRCLNACDYKSPACIKVIGTLDIKGNDQIKRVYDSNFISPTLQTMREPKIQVKSATSKGYEVAEQGDSINLSNPNSETRRGRVGKQVAQTLDCACNQAVVEERIRKLTPLECWRLQDFSDEAFYKAQKVGVSNSQLYKQAGNSMSVNVLEMIFNQIEKTRFKNDGGLF